MPEGSCFLSHQVPLETALCTKAQFSTGILISAQENETGKILNITKYLIRSDRFPTALELYPEFTAALFKTEY